MSMQEEKAIAPKIVRMLESRSTRVFCGIVIALLSILAMLPSLRVIFHSDGSFFMFITCSIFALLCYVSYAVSTRALHCARRVPNRARQVVAFCATSYILGFFLPSLLVLICFERTSSPRNPLLLGVIALALAVRYGSNLLYKKIFDDPVGLWIDRDTQSDNASAEISSDSYPFALRILDIFAVRIAISFLVAAIFSMAARAEWEPRLLLKEPVYGFVLTLLVYNIITQVFLQCMKRKLEKANSMLRFFCAYTAALILPFGVWGIFCRDYVMNLSVKPFFAYLASSLIACLVIDFLIYKYAEKRYKKIFDDPIGFKSIPKTD